MALSGWQIESARNAKMQMEAANRRRMELLNPSAPELPEGAVGGLESMVSEYNRAYGEARSANEARYQEMLRISQGETQRQRGIFGEMRGVAEQTTGQRAADIRSAGVEQESDIMQRLARQGMAGTTVAPTMQEGVKRWTSEKLNRLADTMQQTKLGIMGRQADPQQGATLGIMERREDVYPSQAPLLGALGAVGSGYGGQGLTAMIKSFSKMRS